MTKRLKYKMHPKLIKMQDVILIYVKEYYVIFNDAVCIVKYDAKMI